VSISSRSSPSSTESTTSKWAVSSNLRSIHPRDSVPLVPSRSPSPAVTKRHRRAPRRPALHALAPGARRENQTRPGRACATGSRFPSCPLSPTGATWVHGPQADWASELRLPPHCGRRHGRDGGQETKESRPVTAFFERRPPGRDVARLNDAARGSASVVGMALAVRAITIPSRLPSLQAQRHDERSSTRPSRHRKSYGKFGQRLTFDDIEQRRRDRWNFLSSRGMWFQDRSTTDFRPQPSSASSPTPRRRRNLLLRVQHRRPALRKHSSRRCT